MQRRLELTLILAMALGLLSGCGFHLRGTGTARLVLTSINVTATDAYGSMQRTLERSLREFGVKVVSATKAPYTLHLLSDSRTRRSIATTSDVRVAEYQLKLAVRFEMLDAAGKQIIPPTTVFTERTYQFDNSSLVGNTEQEGLLNREMRRDVADQIIRRADATVRSRMNQHQ